MRFLGNFYFIPVLTFLFTNAVFCLGSEEITKKELRIRHDDSPVLESELNSEILNRLVRSDRNNTRLKEVSPSFAEMETGDPLRSGSVKQNFGSSTIHGDGTGDKTDDDSLLGSTSDYVLIAMIVAMMFCMTLCCLCLFCRSSSRLTICGINFELNDRRNSFEEGENQSEIHDVVPLTPTTAGDFNNRLPDIENMLRGDAPPPMYNEIVKKAEAKDCQAKAEGKRRSGKFKRKSNSDRASETSSVRSNGGRRSSAGRNSWRFSGRGIFASFRSKSSMLRSRRSDSAIQCPTVREGVVLSCNSDDALPPTIEEVEAVRPRAENHEDASVETIDEVTKANNESQGNKVFVYDVHELRPEDDDDVFL